MAGTAKPNISSLNSEAKYNFIGGTGSQGSQASGLFNGITANEQNTSNVMYWYSSTEYVEVEFYEDINIWRAGTTTWGSSIAPLKIKKYNSVTLSYDDVTANYTQTLTNINENQWEKTIENLPKGKYKFEGTGLRIDSEWYIESLLEKRLAFKNQITNIYYSLAEKNTYYPSEYI